MAFDHSARDTQVSRIVEHAAGERIRLRFGSQTDIPALIMPDKPTATEALRGGGAKLEIITLARGLLDLPLPTVGKHFTDSTGKIYAIAEDRSTSFSPTLVYACRTT